MDMAVKVMDQSFIRKENKASFVITERKVMSRLAHPSIVKFYCSFRVRRGGCSVWLAACLPLPAAGWPPCNLTFSACTSCRITRVCIWPWNSVAVAISLASSGWMFSYVLALIIHCLILAIAEANTRRMRQKEWSTRRAPLR